MAELYSSWTTKVLATLCLCGGFFCCGLMLCMLGPTLLDLGAQTRSSISSLGYLFTSRSCLYLTGSMIGGETIDRIQNPYFLLSASFALVGISSFLVPLTSSIFTLAALLSAQGFSMGLLDTGGNVLILRFWGRDCGPWVQALHLSFGVGAFLAPLIAEPFLAFEEHNDDDDGTIVQGLSTLEVRWAYYVIAFLSIPLCLAFFAWGLKPVKIPPREESAAPELAHRRHGRFRNIVMMLAFLLFFMYVGMEVGFGYFIFTYAHEYVGISMDKSSAALLTSVFWGCFAAGRLLSIPLAARFSPISLLLFDFVGSLLSGIFMLVFNKNAIVLWVTSGFLGLSIASVYPSGIHLIEVYIDVTGRVASVFVVGSALGAVAVPLAFSQSFESTPLAFLYILLGTLSLACLTFAVMFFYTRAKKRETDAFLESKDEKETLLRKSASACETEA